MSVLIKNGRVWDGERFFFADVLTKGKLVEKIQPNIREEADFVFDASGKTVSCGLVDAHVHLKGVSSEQFGINAEMCSLPFGVTAVADASAYYGNRATLDCFGVKNVVFVEVSVKGNRADFANALKKMQDYGDKVVGLKVYFDKGISGVRDSKPLKETVDFAREHDLIVMVHSSNQPVSMQELLGTLQTGDILTHAYHGGEHNASLDGYACMHEANARGVVIDAGLAAHIHTDFAVLRGAIEQGALPDVISTDITKSSAYKRGGRYGLPMCMSIAKHLGMQEEDIFKAVTSAPAKVLGKRAEWGYLQVGRAADIAVLEYTNEGFALTDKAGNHIESKLGYQNVFTVLDGDVVYRR